MIYKDEYRLTVGQRLQGIRGARDQRTFADAVDSVQQTISKYERGEIPRSWLFLARLGAQEGVDLNELQEGVDLNELLAGFSAGQESGQESGGNGHVAEAPTEAIGAPFSAAMSR
jgi:transcriptional regulator with XRE-family HTH domain